MKDALFPGFSVEDVQTSGATIRVLRKGAGPALLLLHGYPQTHVTWHKIASRLAERFSVVVPDLRGYGDSSKPEGGARHEHYSFRAMAQDQRETMQHFGHSQFFVAGHDRGGRVAHRLCLDHPKCVRKVCVLDIAPTLTMYRDTNQAFASQYFWWFFLIQPAPLPEHLIGLDPNFYLERSLRTPSASDPITPEARREYARCFTQAATIHATCEDYRAAAEIDLEFDRADDDAGHKIGAPLHALWGARGVVAKFWDVLATWREKSSAPVSGKALDCGHYLPEERPDEVFAELTAFFEETAV
jgi:haloacetate dehalogenase